MERARKGSSLGGSETYSSNALASACYAVKPTFTPYSK